MGIRTTPETMKTADPQNPINAKILCRLLAALALSICALPSLAQAQDINLTGYTAAFNEDFNSPDWTNSSPKGASVWRSSNPPVSNKFIGLEIHDQACMSINNGVLVNKLQFMSSADVSGAHCAGPLGMKNGSGTALVNVATLGSQINTRSGLAWSNAGFVGMKFTTPAAGLTISQLGRYNIAGSAGSNYDIRVFDSATMADVAQAIVTLNGQPAGWVYANIVGGNKTLQGSHVYYLMCFINDGVHATDSWYDGNTSVTASGGITISESEWGNWHSGNLFSVDAAWNGFTQQYGYWEARVKMPAGGTGVWPSFCTYSTNQTGNNEEMDIFEYYGGAYPSGGNGGALMRNHNWPQNTNNANINPLATQEWANYHIYGYQVDPQYCTYYVDGAPVAQYATPTSYITAPSYMTLEYNVGGFNYMTGVVANSEMDVDWVRVWSTPTVAPVITSPTSAAATVGTAFNYQIAANNGATHYNATSLPGGLSVDPLTGLISGTPTTAGVYSVGLSASNANGTGTATLVVTVASSGTPTFEAESLTVAAQTAGVTYRIVGDSRFSGAEGAYFDATAASQFLTYDVPNIAARTYDVRVGLKSWNNKGIWQLAISRLDQQGSPTNVGPAVDGYTSGEVFSEVDLGHWTPGSTSDKAFKFTVTGKNAASTGYGLAIDYIKLIPQ